MIINTGYYGGSKDPPVYSFTGESRMVKDGRGNWEIQFLTSGSLIFPELNSAKTVDLFLVGGGYPGDSGTGASTSTWGRGGDGGDGGKRMTKKGVKLQQARYTITVGGEAQNTAMQWRDKVIASSASGVSSTGGAGSGRPGNQPTSAESAGSPGNAGGFAFDEPGNPIYGGSGGGGAYNGGQSSGGPGGGGRGTANGYGGAGEEGTDGKGGGGGGGRGGPDGPKSGGAGGRGILLMRNSKRRVSK